MRVQSKGWSGLFAVWLCLHGSARAGVSGDKDLFPLLAKGFADNWDAVHTWSGEATVEQTESSHSQAGKTSSHWKAEIKFVFDKPSGSSRWEFNYTLIERNDVQQPAYCTRGMVKDGLLYDTKSTEGVPFPGPAALHLRPKPDKAVPVDDVEDRFHPMAYVRQLNHDTPASLGSYHAHADDAALTARSIARDGSLVILTSGSETTVLNRNTFDLSKGCNIVSRHDKDSSVEETEKADYEKVAEVFVPSKVEIEHVTEYPTHGSRTKTVVTFTKNVVNEELAADEFTVEKLGIRPGDTVFNHITGSTDKYKKPAR